MNIRITCRGFLHLGLTTLLLCTLGMAPSPSAGQHLWEFVPAPKPPEQNPASSKLWIIQERKIRLHQQTLDALRDPEPPLPPGIILDLTEDTAQVMLIDSKTPGMLSTVVLHGHLRQADHSEVTLVIKDKVITGTIRFDNRVFKLHPIANDEHLLVEIDPEKLPPD